MIFQEVLAGYLQDLFSVTIATKECFLELEPTISFFGGREGDNVLCCPRSSTSAC